MNIIDNMAFPFYIYLSCEYRFIDGIHPGRDVCFANTKHGWELHAISYSSKVIKFMKLYTLKIHLYSIFDCMNVFNRSHFE